jgi:F0F1-type ATP synthase membrane subunit b/b'
MFQTTNEELKQHLAAGADVNSIIVSARYQGKTSLDRAEEQKQPEVADLLRKHGGKRTK